MLDANVLARLEQYLDQKDYRHAASVIIEQLAYKPDSEDLRDILGDVYFLAGDKVNAGRQWYFCSRNDSAAQEARAVFEAHFNHHPALLYDALRINFNTAKLPQEFHFRIEGLRTAGRQRGLQMGSEPPAKSLDQLKKEKDKSGCCGCITVIAILILIKLISTLFS